MLKQNWLLKQNWVLLIVGFLVVYLFFTKFWGNKSEPFFGNLSDTWNLVPAQSFDYEEMHNYFDESRNVTPDFDTFTCGFGTMSPNDPYLQRTYVRDTVGQISD